MSGFQSALVAAGLVVIPVILAGLYVKRLYRGLFWFPVYLTAVWLSELLTFVDPDRFYNWRFWLVKETLIGVIKVAMLYEIVSRAFAAFPGARRTASVFIALACWLIVFSIVFTASEPFGRRHRLEQDLISTLANGTALAYGATWAFFFWYHVPLDRLHRAILGPLVVYMLLFASVARILQHYGFGSRDALSLGIGVAYVVLEIFWAVVVWTDRPPPDDPIRRQLSPWRYTS